MLSFPETWRMSGENCEILSKWRISPGDYLSLFVLNEKISVLWSVKMMKFCASKKWRKYLRARDCQKFGFKSTVEEILLVNGFTEWSANISVSIRGLFCIVFLLLLVSFCVRWKSMCGRGALIWLAGVSGGGGVAPGVTRPNQSQSFGNRRP